MTHQYKVHSNKLITPSIRSLTFMCEDGVNPLLYQPGQYAAISLHDKLRPTAFRCFSISSSPSDQRMLQLSVRVSGKYTKALERLQVGDEVFIRGPFGSFVFNEHKHKNLVLFAGGIGISPFMSMVRYATDLSLKNKIHLIYSCRNQDDIAFFDELNGLQRQNPNLLITYVITKGEHDRLHGLPVVSGRIDGSNINRLRLNYLEETYMICGPSSYIDTMQMLLGQSGVPRNKILSEAFSQGSHSQSETLIRWPSNTYALAGLSFALAGFFIVATDLNKTLPTLEASTIPIQVGNNITVDGGDINAKINSIRPQVETKITQEPIIKYVYVVGKGSSQPATATITPTPSPISTPKPTIVPTKPKTITQAPAPKPTPTVVPTSKPKTKVS